jgi:hypothetical protein
LSVGDHPLSLAVGDFDGDSIVDLAVANEGNNDVSILIGEAATASSSSLELMANLGQLGRLNSNNSANRAVTGDDDVEEDSIQPEDSLLAVNEALEQLTYQPTLDFTEQHLDTAAINDQEFITRDISDRVLDQIFLEVRNEI